MSTLIKYVLSLYVRGARIQGTYFIKISYFWRQKIHNLSVHCMQRMHLSVPGAGFPNLFDLRPPCLDTEDLVTPSTYLYHDHDDYFEIWLIISGILWWFLLPLLKRKLFLFLHLPWRPPWGSPTHRLGNPALMSAMAANKLSGLHCIWSLYNLKISFEPTFEMTHHAF